MTKDDIPQAFEKKTERLDIRLSHRKKEDFTQACVNQGDTPSHAVRRFISTYIRRANNDEMVSAIRFSPWKKRLAWTASAILIALIGTTIWRISSTRNSGTLTAEVFDIYDANKNGIIELGEISPYDFHLHRVLNIDGEDGISKAEFQPQGLMTWRFVDPVNSKIIKVNTGSLKQTSVITFNVSPDGKPLNLNQKMFVKRNGEFVELNNEADWEEFLASDLESIKEHGHIENFAESADVFLVPPEKTAEMREYEQKYNTKYVRFDLRKPNHFELTIFEQEGFGAIEKSVTSFQRGVTWVEGRSTPELVMGMGREKAVLTKQETATQ